MSGTPVVILKFGGRLVETPERIRQASDYILRLKKSGEDPVVVVSAPGKTTDEFIMLAKQVAPNPDSREMDMLLSVGERMAMSLLAMAINERGPYRAVSFTGSQVGIITDTKHTNASILEVKGYRIREALSAGKIPIIAGFQGVSTEKEITTLGRGGSDATAVALAVALNAVRCELVKEVGGVYTADPNIVEDAVLHPRIDYTTMEAMASAGANVVQYRAVSLARQHEVKLAVKDTTDQRSTLVSDFSLNDAKIAGLTVEKDVGLTYLHSFDELIVSTDHILAWWHEQVGFVLHKSSAGAASDTVVDMISLVFWGNRVDVDCFNAVHELLAKEKTRPIAAGISDGRIYLLVDNGHGGGMLALLHDFCTLRGYLRVG